MRLTIVSRALFFLCLALLPARLLAAPGATPAGGTVEALTLQASKDGASVALKTSLPVPRFTCTLASGEPRQVLIDFPEAASRLKKRYVLEGPLVREALVEKKPEAGLALRIRLTLGEGSLTSVEQDQQGVILHFAAGTPVKAKQAAAPSPAEYRVGVGDTIEIEVFGHADLTRALEVRGDGTIDYPLIGHVSVAGRSLPEIDQELTRSLGKDFLIDPQVSVEVKDYGSQWVTVIGEVRTPGRQVLRRDMHLIDVLAEAGGFTAFANRRRVEILRSEEHDRRRKVIVNIKEIEDGKSPDVILRTGDIVIVARQAF